MRSLLAESEIMESHEPAARWRTPTALAPDLAAMAIAEQDLAGETPELAALRRSVEGAHARRRQVPRRYSNDRNVAVTWPAAPSS
jgi:hypothetical protein